MPKRDTTGLIVIGQREESEFPSQELMQEEFDDEGYLNCNPDVATAIAKGEFSSAWDHFALHGRGEGRRFKTEQIAGLPVENQPAPVRPTPDCVGETTPCFLENIMFSRGGGFFVVGWVDDYTSKLNRIVIEFPMGPVVTLDGSRLGRVRRQDVEAALNSRPYPYGFWGFIYLDHAIARPECVIKVCLSNGSSQVFKRQTRALDDAEILNVALSYIAGAEYFGNKQIHTILNLERALGQDIVDFNKKISRHLCSNPYVECSRKVKRRVKGSIIVCLYGRAEYMFLQGALFSNLPGIEDYEFIYVSNSPELAEQLLCELKINKQIYGLEQTLVLLPGNAGFGAANNIASRYAYSDRFLIINPDVFPRDRDWAKKHTEVVATLPRHQTTLFGVPLYYDDGSLMHGGMYFEVDSMLSIGTTSMDRRDFIRVEHYGKGCPSTSSRFLGARPVPAVTGAFMSMDRRWFERLGGFTEDFVFGHYEDADLCLKSLQRGQPSWIHDIKLWHLEGKGSVRLPVHEGGSLINRWIFSKKWGDLIQGKLCGVNPPLETFAETGLPEPNQKPYIKNTRTNGSRAKRPRKDQHTITADDG